MFFFLALIKYDGRHGRKARQPGLGEHSLEVAHDARMRLDNAACHSTSERRVGVPTTSSEFSAHAEEPEEPGAVDTAYPLDECVC